MALFVLEPRLVRASLRSNAKREKITSVEQAIMFCFPRVSRLVKKKGKIENNLASLKEIDNFKIILVKFQHLLLKQ